MDEIKHMYLILEQMVDGAVKGDLKTVKDLNKAYETLAEQVYHTPRTPLDLDYDNCRVSCVTAFTFSNLYQELVLDAKRRFSKLHKP